MRKFVIACMALAMMAGCSKEKLLTEPCSFDIKVNWERGSRVQITVTPANDFAYYSYGVMMEEDYQRYTESEVLDIQLEWMYNGYFYYTGDDVPSCSFTDMYFFQGERSLRLTPLEPGTDYRFLVFQINPETNKPIGSIHQVPFHTAPVDKSPMNFKLECSGTTFTIIPEDQERTYFWDYELDDTIFELYWTPAYFFTSLIDMYDQYDFLDHLISMGTEEWELPVDDRSIREDEPYTLAISGCDYGGEITSDIYYADFVYHQGYIMFGDADFPIEYK